MTSPDESLPDTGTATGTLPTPPEAPYGLRSDGTPRGKPGPKRGQQANVRPGGPSAPPRRPAGPRPTAAKSKQPDYRPGINGILQMAAFPLAVAGKRNPTFALDAAAISIHGPNIAEALNVIAQEHPEVAAALERILSVGPYGLLIGAMIPLVAQVATNHGLLPGEVAAGMGAMSKADLLAQLNPPE